MPGETEENVATAITVVSMSVTGLVCVVSGFVAGLSGFGSAIFFQLLWLAASFQTDQVGSLTTSLSILWFVAISVAAPLVYSGVKDKAIIWPISFSLAPGAALLVFLGGWLLVNLSLDVLTVALGIIFLAFAVYQTVTGLLKFRRERFAKQRAFHENRDIEMMANVVPVSTSASTSSSVSISPVEGVSPVDRNMGWTPTDHETKEQSATAFPIDTTVIAVDAVKEEVGSQAEVVDEDQTVGQIVGVPKHRVTRGMIVGAMITGCFSGVLGGAFGTGGPPIMIYFSKIHISKSQIRGTVQAMGLFVMPFKMVSLIVFDIIKLEEWPLYLMAPVFCNVGILVGKKFHDKIDEDGIKLVLQLFIMVASVSLLDPQLDQWHGILFVCIYVVAALVFVTAAYEAYKAWRHRQELAHDKHESVESEKGDHVSAGLLRETSN